MAENPATWGSLERCIHNALSRAFKASSDGYIGFSFPKQIAVALEEAGLVSADYGVFGVLWHAYSYDAAREVEIQQKWNDYVNA